MGFLAELGRFFVKLLGALLHSLLVSVIMLILAFSLITKQFPPDFARIQKSFLDIKTQTTQATQQILDLQKKIKDKTANEEGGDSIERDVEAMEKINLAKAKLRADLLGENDEAPHTAIRSDDKELKSEIREMQAQIFKLQNRVNQLEAQTQDRKKINSK